MGFRTIRLFVAWGPASRKGVGLVLLAALGLTASVSLAATFRVPADVGSIQTAIDGAASGDTILVAAGTYHERLTFVDGRVLSVVSESGPEQTVLNGDSAGNVVSFGGSVSRQTLLEGFTIINGRASSDVWGSGIACIGSPTIRNCTITGNGSVEEEYGNGGGMFTSGSPLIVNCTFSNNTAYEGGAFACDSATPVIRGCTFTGNSTPHAGGALGIWRSEARIEDCTITNNTAGSLGGGIALRWGSNATITGCEIGANSAPLGGGLHIHMSTPAVMRCDIHDNTATSSGGGVGTNQAWGELRNCVIRGNQATGDNGGGIHCNSSTQMQVTGCVLYGNSAASAGGGIAVDGTFVTVTNCTIVDNSAANQGGGVLLGADSYDVFFYNDIVYYNTAPTGANWHNAAGGPSYFSHSCTTPLNWDGIDAEPVFVARLVPAGADGVWLTEDDGLRIQAGSPCVDTGSNLWLSYLATVLDDDAAGSPRVQNSTVDVGAYEYTPVTVEPKDRTVDVGDPVTFSVTASSATSITYQWFKDGEDINGAQTSSYSMGAAQGSDEGVYSCQVSTDEKTYVSRAAELMVRRFLVDAVSVPEGAQTDLSVTLSGEPTDALIVEISKVIDRGDADLAVAGTASITFTSDSWQEPAIIAISAAEDDTDTVNGTATFRLHQTGGSDTLSDVDVVVTEADDDVTVTLQVVGNGTTTPDAPVIVDTNNVMPYQITATPGPGHRFAGWSGDTDAVAQFWSPDTTVQSTTDVTLTAMFEAFTDDDGDGMDDTWEADYWGDTSAKPGDDDDRDGWTNLEEFQRGTNPTDYDAVVHVPADHPTIQLGIDMANAGNTVLVADGTYYENVDFGDKAVVLQSENGAASCVINGGGNGSTVRFGGATRDTVLDGFTITNGLAQGDDWGGGIACQVASPVITNCIVTGNGSTESEHGNGGGMFVGGLEDEPQTCSPLITNCTFSNNTAYEGGAFACDSAAPVIQNCTFSGNTTPLAGGALGIWRSAAVIEECTITGNTADSLGGGVSLRWGSFATLTDCTITGNSAPSGGGIHFHMSDPVIERCEIHTNTAATSGGGIGTNKAWGTVRNCVIRNNTASDNGGGIYCNESTQMQIQGCVIHGNTTSSNGGGIYVQGQLVHVTNCTVVANSATGNGGGLALSADAADVTANNSILYFNTASSDANWHATGGLYLTNCCTTPTARANTDTDPLFVDRGQPAGADTVWGTDDDGLRLQAASPCVDTGDNSILENITLETDVRGVARVQNTTVDMGAYEYLPITIDGPDDQTLVPGTDGNFAVVVSNGVVQSYQWRKDGTDIPGATGSQFDVIGITAADAGAYSCSITTAEGQFLSLTAQLYVAEPLTFVFDRNPLSVPEGWISPFSGDGVVSVALSAQPLDEIVAEFAFVSGDGDLRPAESYAVLRFTPSDWDQAHQVAFSAAEDDADSTDGQAVYRLSKTGGSNPVADADLTVAEVDDDVAVTLNAVGGGTVSPDGLSYHDTDHDSDASMWINASFDGGVRFSHWSGDTENIESPWDASTRLWLYQSDDAVLTAHFEPFQDNDEDGMDDQWEWDQFGTYDRDGTDDDDDDGITDYWEFRRKTDPHAPTPLLHPGWNLSSIWRAPDDYSVHAIYGDDILRPAWTWQNGGYIRALDVDPVGGLWLYLPGSHDVAVAVNADLTAPDTDGDGFSDAQEADRLTDPNAYVIVLDAGWNLVSIARVPADNSVYGIFRRSIAGPAWGWDTDSSAYVAVDKLVPTASYWAYAPAPAVIVLDVD